SISGRRVVSGMCASSGCATFGASTPSTSSSTAARLGATRSGSRSCSRVAASGDTDLVWLDRALAKQVADLGQQRDILGRSLGSGLLLRLAPGQESVQRPGEGEKAPRRDGQDREQHVTEVPVGELRAVDRERQRGEVRL